MSKIAALMINNWQMLRLYEKPCQLFTLDYSEFNFLFINKNNLLCYIPLLECPITTKN